jgi:PhnB protein
MKLHAYLNFDGTCEEAFRYYEQHLGAKVVGLMKWNQMPDAEKHTPPGISGDKVLHGALAIADTMVMASDIPGKPEPMRSAYLSLTVDSNEEAERVYKALADGGQVFMALNETFFAHRFGQLRDKFGVNWMVLHQKPMQP